MQQWWLLNFSEGLLPLLAMPRNNDGVVLPQIIGEIGEIKTFYWTSSINCSVHRREIPRQRLWNCGRYGDWHTDNWGCQSMGSLEFIGFYRIRLQFFSRPCGDPGLWPYISISIVITKGLVLSGNHSHVGNSGWNKYLQGKRGANCYQDPGKDLAL